MATLFKFYGGEESSTCKQDLQVQSEGGTTYIMTREKLQVAPPRGFTWEGVLESAMNELENAKENGDQARCDQLRTSIQIAKRNVKLGKPFPVSPN